MTNSMCSYYEEQEKLEAWKARLVQEFEFTEEEGADHVSRLVQMLQYMRKEAVILAYRLKTGKFTMVSATLMNYESWFNCPFIYTKLRNTIPFWNFEKKHWSTFEMENFMDWKAEFTL